MAIRWSGLIALTIVYPYAAQAQGVVSELITFLQPDGRSAVVYETLRSSARSYSLRFRTPVGKPPESLLAPYLYVYPNEHRLVPSREEGFTFLQFPQGSFATLKAQPLGVAVGDDGTYTFKSWDGVLSPEGRVGRYVNNGSYARFAYVWVFPDNFEIVSYEANRSGQWVLRQSTLAYYGTEVNELAFTIAYRPRSRRTFDSLSSIAAPNAGVAIEQLDRGVRMNLAATVLFAPGSKDLSAQGETLLGEIARSLAKLDVRIAVEGHTDNVPIQGALARIYPTNWELSGARAMAVVRFLSAQGVPESRLEARAFGATRPRAGNSSEAEREKNRRIEVVVTEQDQTAPPSAP
jgi:flagellar motor protein MotB